MRYCLITLLALLNAVSIRAQSQNSSTMQGLPHNYEVHKTALSDSLQLAYIDEGVGQKTILFIHGLGSNHKAWYKNVDLLKNSFRCIAVDLPGYGKSSKGDFPYDMSFFASTIHEFIVQMKLEKVILVGHSMGGQIAINTVLQHSEPVEKLVLIAPAGLETFSTQEKEWFKALVTPELIMATAEERIVKNFEMNFYAMPDDARFMIDDRLRMRQTSAYQHYCQMIPKCVMGMLNEPVFDQLPKIILPTLVFFGENDQLIPNKLLHPALSTEEVAMIGQNRFPNSQVSILSEAGHFVQWEKAEQLNREILNFLK